MPLIYNPEEIERFFGTSGELCETCGTNRKSLWVDYAGPLLKYTVIFHLDDEAVAVSGAEREPFGGDSMYEIYVPCTEVRAVTNYKGRTSLIAFYGGTDINQHRQLAIGKTKSGELKVWPYRQFPSGHGFAGE